MHRIIFLITFIYTVKSFCYNYTIQDAGGIYGSYFSPNGTTLGIAHTNSYVNFWDKYNKTKIGTHNYGTWADRITYSKNGKYIAVGGQKNIIHILNSTNFAYILSINTGIISVAYKADFRYDDKLLLICGSGNQIQFWNVPAWTLNKTISLPSYSPYFDCQYAPDNKFVVTGAAIITFDASYTQTNIYYASSTRVAVHPNSQQFVVTLNAPKYLLGFWNGTYIYIDSPFNTSDCDYSLDGKYLAIVGTSNLINIYNATTNTLLKSVDTVTATKQFAVRLSDDSRYLLTADTYIGNVYLYYRSDYLHFNNCSDICGDFFTITFLCDNQIGIDYDGCDNNCNVMNNFSCSVNNTVTICSYDGIIQVNMSNFVQTTFGIYNMTVSVFPPLYSYEVTSQQDFLDMFSIDGAIIHNVQYNNVTNKFNFLFQPALDILNKSINLTYTPTNSSNPMYSKGQTQTFDLKLTSQACGDSYAWILPCDNQIGIPYDGCNDTCAVMDNFDCWVIHTLTTCSYNGIFTYNFTGFHQQTLGVYNMSVILHPPLYAFTQTNQQQFLSMFSINKANITSISYNNITSQFTFILESTPQNIENQIILNYFPLNNSNLMYSKGQNQQFFLIFNNSNTSQIQNLQQYSSLDKLLTSIMYYGSYIILTIGIISLIFGFCTKKLAGLQALFVLQFTFVSFLWINSNFILPFTSIYPLKYTFGYNYKFIPQNLLISQNIISSQNSTSPYIQQFDLSPTLLINNFNFFPILLIISSLITLIIYIVYRLHTKQNSQSFLPNKSMSSTMNSAIDSNSYIDAKSLKIQKYYKFSSYFLLNIAMLSIISVISLSLIQFKNKLIEYYYNYIVSITILFIIFMVLILLVRNTTQFEYFKQSFDKQKRFAHFHYILYTLLLISITLLVILLPQYPWISLIHIVIMSLLTLIYRPYKYLRQNIRSFFNLFAIGIIIGFRIYAKYVQNINSQITYILMMVLILGILLLVVIMSLISIIYSRIIQKRSQLEQILHQSNSNKNISQETTKNFHSKMQQQTAVTKYQSSDDNKSVFILAELETHKNRNFIEQHLTNKENANKIKNMKTQRTKNNKIINFDDEAKDNKSVNQKIQAQDNNNKINLKNKKYKNAYRLKHAK